MKRVYDWSKDRVERAVKENYCYSDVLRALGISTRGRNCDTLKNKITTYGLDTSHFTFVSKTKGQAKKKPIEELLVKGSNTKTYTLKHKLLEIGLKENKCEICGVSEWLGKPLICQLHHIDGDETNNELSNLQMLCPNCHSQTDNYCGNANKIAREKKFCINCGREITQASKSGLCVSCAGKLRMQRTRGSSEEPTKDELDRLIRERSFREIGRLYNVTDTAIKKWCKKYGLPSTKTELGLINLTPIPFKKCDHCGKEFKPTTRTQRFCSSKCQISYQSKHGGFDNRPVLEEILSKDLLLELHKTLSWNQIAEKYNTSRNCINHLRKHYGIYGE